ncbi:hypothetical protein ABBQ38_007418 [Trebouxia sp. C0009 RCD-2024]
MADGAVHAERLARSAEDPKHPGRDCSEEDEVEASYKENFAGNAQAAVDEFMSNMGFLEREGDLVYVIPKGHVQGMNVPAKFYASPELLKLVSNEFRTASGGFTGAVQQLANVATLPGIVGSSIGMPDIHSGYGFAVGNVAAFDMDDPASIVSPGGVGFDINCGVRLIRTDLSEEDVNPVKAKLADNLFHQIPVGVGGKSDIKLTPADVDQILATGMKWTQQHGHSWPEDSSSCEEFGCYANADPSQVSDRAKKRGKTQLGTLGAGNHYVEVQVVEQVYDEEAAKAMQLQKGTVCIMIHTGSRGLGHQICTDFLSASDRALARSKIKLVDRQLACMPIQSPEGQGYLKAMAAAANFAFANRSLITAEVRSAFEKTFNKSARDLGMYQVYDVTHNTAKEEEHQVDGQKKRLLVHRKGATRAYPPGHPSLPERYQKCGQPVLIGGSMGTSSYVLVGTQQAMERTFGSTCHGAGRAMSRAQSKKTLGYKEVMKLCESRGVTIRVATEKLIAEEAPESYKDVSQVVETCHNAGISKLVVKLRPIAVIKG